MAERPKKAQVQRFKEAARELGADESEEAFDKALRKVGEYRPPKDETGEKPKGKKPGQ